MSPRRAVVAVAMVAAVGVAVWARRGGDRVPAPAPLVDHTEEEPGPIEQEAPVAPEPPPLAESPSDFVVRILRALADAPDRTPEAREAELATMIDTSSFVPAMFGSSWGLLSAEQRARAERDFQALVVAQALRGARSWLLQGPRVTAVDDAGTKARVRTISKDDTDVCFVVARSGARPVALVDVEVEGVSFVTSYKRQIERLLETHDRDPAYVLARLSTKLAHVRENGAP